MDICKSRLRIVVAAALSFALACCLGCGSNSAKVANPSLAVADNSNSRVLAYSDPVSKATSAAVVLGQGGFNDSRSNRGTEVSGADTMSSPSSLAKDSAGNLYVADSGNARVLIFRPPFTTGMKASVVIGQPDFTSSNPLVGPASTASGMGSAYSVAIDGNGNLWVVDTSNSRVLEYVPPFSNGMAATLAIGQTSTGAATVCYMSVPTANNLCFPDGAAFDSTGDLWVSDHDNHRVLEYLPPFSTGMAASLELGQPGATAFTSGSLYPPSATSLGAPYAITFDSSGNLWLADTGFNRVLKYAPPFSNGMAAATVLGQTDFNHGDQNQGGSSPASNTLASPFGLAFDGAGNLSVADASNSRVLVFAPPFNSGMNASAVIGQTSFTAGSSNGGANDPTAKTLGLPFGLSTF